MKFGNHMDNRSQWLRRWTHNIALTALLFTSSGISGGGVYIYMHDKQLGYVQRQLDSQSQDIKDLSKDIQKILAENSNQSENTDSPAFCTCISIKSNPQRVEICPAVNSVCDSQSREICEAQKPEFKC